jgi:hypothetical protein
MTPRFLKALQHQEQALSLKLRGFTYRMIAGEMNLSRAGAHRCVARALAATRAKVEEDTETLRCLEAARLDSLLQSVWLSAMRGNLESVHCAVRVLESRRKLMGLDMPMKIAPCTVDGEDIYGAASRQEILDVAARMTDIERAKLPT